MSKETKAMYEFEGFQLYPQERLLLRGEKRVELTPKAFNALLILVQGGGRLVSKNELLNGLWPDSHVEEANLKVTIGMLRKALSDAQNRDELNKGKLLIETIPKEGYRFLAEIRCSGNPVVQENQVTAEAASDTNGSSLEASHRSQTEHQDLPLDSQLTRQHHIWLVVLGFAAFLSVMADLALARPRGIQLLRDVIGLLLASSSLYLYRRLSSVLVKRPAATDQTAAFRGLLPFEPSDASRFYGRHIETAAIVDLVSHSEFRFGVLYGDSGCGKTSVIRAGLIPKLELLGYLAVHCRAYKDPAASIVKECRRRSNILPEKNESPADYLGRIAEESDSGLVIICDQFEEFWINFTNKWQRAPFFEFLSRCHQVSCQSPIKFLFAVRSDFFHFIVSAFDEGLPEAVVTSRRYHLRLFDEGQAVEVIEKSVRTAQWPFERELTSRVARDLIVNGMVLPSELQIVGEQLQNKRIFRLEQYEKTGGKEQLVHSYLQDVIRLTGEEETAQLILRCLISEDDTRLTLPLSEIQRRVQRSERLIVKTLNMFFNMRLVREIQDEEPWRYELVHEYLIGKINGTTGKIMDATQRANRYLRQYLSNYILDKGTRVPIARLWFIHRYTDLERDEQQRQLLRKSLWRGLWQAGIFVVVLAAFLTATAAWFSIREEWEEVLLSDGHTAGVHRVAFSPDGRLLVSCGEDSRVIVWDFARRLKLATLVGHTGWVHALAFSPDGKWFVTGGYDSKVIVWDSATFAQAKVLSDNGGHIGALGVSSDGSLLAVVTDHAGTFVWSTATWQELATLPANREYGAAWFSDDNRKLFISGSGWWELWTRRLAKKVSTDENWATISPDKKFLASIDPLGGVTFTDISTFHEAATIRGHQDNGRAVAYSPDGRLVATGAENIVLWNAIARTKIVRFTYPSIVWSLAFSPDGRWLVSSHGDGSILVWNPVEHELVANLSEHSAPVRAVAFSHDGQRIASGGEDDSVIVWNVAHKSKDAVMIGHKGRVMGVAFSPDDRSIASTDQNGFTVYWDLQRGMPKWTAQNWGNYCLAMSPDGRWVATTRSIYSSGKGEEVVKNLDGGWGIAFSHDSRWLAYPGWEPGSPFRGVPNHLELVIYDTETWKTVDHQELAGSTPVTLSFSPNAKLLVTGDDEGAVNLWETKPLKEAGILGWHSARIKSVAFSPDGKEVASAGDDHVIHLWNVQRTSHVATIGIHASPVLSIAFSPDGKHLVSGEHDNSVRLYTRHRSLWGHQLN